MNNIWITSDLHIGHNKEFLYGNRGFASSEKHDKALVENWNKLVQEDDIVYVFWGCVAEAQLGR